MAWGGADTIEVAVNVADLDEMPAQPAPPWVLSTVQTTTGLDVLWMEPDANGGPSIVGYEVQYRTGTEGEWINFVHEGTNTHASITELFEAMDYQARVRGAEWRDAKPMVSAGCRKHRKCRQHCSAVPRRDGDAKHPENSEAGDPIGSAVRAVDVDRDSLIYFLEGTDAENFQIDPHTAQIRTKSSLDYESQAAYSVTVTANDGNGGADSINVSIELIDVQEDQAALGPEVPTGLTLGRLLSMDTGSVVQAEITLQWDAPASEETSWFEFRLGRYRSPGTASRQPRSSVRKTGHSSRTAGDASRTVDHEVPTCVPTASTRRLLAATCCRIHLNYEPRYAPCLEERYRRCRGHRHLRQRHGCGMRHRAYSVAGSNQPT